jgi:hypothetical protein
MAERLRLRLRLSCPKALANGPSSGYPGSIKLLGGSMSTDTATSIVNVIGWVDIGLAAAFMALVIGAIRRKAFAYSPVAIGLFGWAATWGFLTALSRFTAVLNGAQVWDVVERGPNYLAPAALV